MVKNLKKFLGNNIYLIVGILIGLYISNSVLYIEENCNSFKEDERSQNILPEKRIKVPVVHVKDSRTKSVSSQTNSKIDVKKKKLIRPRYYSTELGIKQKLFVGIFTSAERINAHAVHINKTIGHLADRIKFFITAQYKLKTKFNLTGVVGFTDTRSKYRPFQVIKYISDNFGQEFDYYFLTNDYTYININHVKEVVQKISVSMDVYLGTRESDSSYCNLDAGIVISNSVLKALREHLDWCVINTVSESNSENIGRCVYHSIGLTCQESVQNQEIGSYKIKHFDLNEHLFELSKKYSFNKASTVYPILQKDDFFILNAYFLRQKLAEIKNTISELSQDLNESWPPGQRPGAKPATRFDLPRQYYFNMTHLFFPDDFTNIRLHSEAELLDIQNIIREVTAKARTGNSNLNFIKLLNGYKKFDLSRGMDYTLDIEFEDLRSGKSVVKRYDVCKPLGKVEFVPVPYVTENSRVTIFLIVQESELYEARQFLNNYVHLMNDKKEKNFLMLVLLYQNGSQSRGKNDVFVDMKHFVTKMSSKNKNEDTKLAWVSIRIPSNSYVSTNDYRAMNFAVVDLALKKIGVDHLILVLDSFCNITADFLNRVRMNTILNSQIFSPIPFRQFNPKISQNDQLEINKNVGHFDVEEYKYISFYGRDYIEARKKIQNVVPLIRVDNDITKILTEDLKSKGNLFEMFLKYSKHIHSMRATEMSLIVKYHEESDQGRCNLFLGNKMQLARLLLDHRNEISKHF